MTQEDSASKYKDCNLIKTTRHVAHVLHLLQVNVTCKERLGLPSAVALPAEAKPREAVTSRHITHLWVQTHHLIAMARMPFVQAFAHA